MAPEKKDKKRKAATAAAVPATDLPNKKSKKTSAAPKSILKKNEAPKDKSNGIAKSTTSEPVSSEPARKIKPRKRASDFLSDDDESDSANKEENKPKTKQSTKKTTEKVEKKKNKTKKPESEDEDEESDAEKEDSHDEEEEDDDDDDDEVDDQTAELIKGFESSGDEDEDASGDEGFDGKVPRIPDSKKAKRKIQKKLKESDHKDVPGTVYVGRIPHGFYEHQMREYFSQFGDITKLRISRNKTTGRSKHYGFIEFASAVVAKIVAETMNNYLMFGHILKCKFVPQEQVHAELWKGANRRYKRVPWNRIEKQRMDRGKTREKWAHNIEREGNRRLSKAQKLKELMGYEYEVPHLKAIDTVPVQQTLPAPEAEVEAAEKDSSAKDTTDIVAVNGDEKKDAETEAAVDEQTPKKKAKKAKKDKGSATPDVKTTPAKLAEDEQTTPEGSAKKGKAKKAKKAAGKA